MSTLSHDYYQYYLFNIAGICTNNSDVLFSCHFQFTYG